MLFFRELKFLFFWEIPNHTAAAWCAAEQCLCCRWLSQRALILTSGSGRWVQEMQKLKALYPLKHISSWWPGRRLTVLSFICSKSTFVKQTLLLGGLKATWGTSQVMPLLSITELALRWALSVPSKDLPWPPAFMSRDSPAAAESGNVGSAVSLL